MLEISKIFSVFLALSCTFSSSTFHNRLLLPLSHTPTHTCTHLQTNTQTPTDAYTEKIYNDTNDVESIVLCLAQWFTRKGPFIETLLDAVGSANVESLGDLLVHEALSVENIGHHHPQVKHLK